MFIDWHCVTGFLSLYWELLSYCAVSLQYRIDQSLYNTIKQSLAMRVLFTSYLPNTNVSLLVYSSSYIWYTQLIYLWSFEEPRNILSIVVVIVTSVLEHCSLAKDKQQHRWLWEVDLPLKGRQVQYKHNQRADHSLSIVHVTNEGMCNTISFIQAGLYMNILVSCWPLLHHLLYV